MQVVLLLLRNKEISAAATTTPENTLNNAREAGLGKNQMTRLSPIDKSYEGYAIGRSFLVSSPPRLTAPRADEKNFQKK
jgi:hypothetical protein